MKLSTQLARGALALPMLLGFGLLAVAGLEPATAQAADEVLVDAALPATQPGAMTALPSETVVIRAVGEVARLCEARGGPRVLALSQAPGDLGRLAVRFSLPCRA
jgi:hypothetical protein